MTTLLNTLSMTSISASDDADIEVTQSHYGLHIKLCAISVAVFCMASQYLYRHDVMEIGFASI